MVKQGTWACAGEGENTLSYVYWFPRDSCACRLVETFLLRGGAVLSLHCSLAQDLTPACPVKSAFGHTLRPRLFPRLLTSFFHLIQSHLSSLISEFLPTPALPLPGSLPAHTTLLLTAMPHSACLPPYSASLFPKSNHPCFLIWSPLPDYTMSH